MWVAPDDLLKLLLAVLLGGAIGAEREVRAKAAGFRTLTCICLGSTLFTILSRELGLPNDTTRIASGIVTGVGFLGAGAILHPASGTVTGLTTAATIWLVAALGMCIGGGQYMLASASAVATLLVLWVFPFFEQWIDRARHTHIYEIVCPAETEKYQALDAIFQQSGLRVIERKRAKSGDYLTCTWQVSGAPSKHELLADKLLSHPNVRDLRI